MTILHPRVLLFVTFTALVPLSLSAAEYRTWTTRDGRFTVEAELIEANDSEVTLRKADRGVVAIAIRKLSQLDGDYVEAWRGERKQAEASSPGIVPDVLGDLVELLSMIDPVRDAQAGRWKRDADALVSSRSSRSRILIPHRLAGPYQLRLVVQRQLDSASLNLGLAVGSRRHGPRVGPAIPTSWLAWRRVPATMVPSSNGPVAAFIAGQTAFQSPFH
ncbi:MAG: SHD1 domain-containing protein [Novipirellula sp. JB048]